MNINAFPRYRLKRWTLLVGSALLIGYLFGRVAAGLLTDS